MGGRRGCVGIIIRDTTVRVCLRKFPCSAFAPFHLDSLSLPSAVTRGDTPRLESKIEVMDQGMDGAIAGGTKLYGLLGSNSRWNFLFWGYVLVSICLFHFIARELRVRLYQEFKFNHVS